MYGSMYGMIKTTLYLPDDLKRALERRAEEEGRPEAEIVREALRTMLTTKLRPTVPLFDDGLGDPTASERVDELLDGFGRR